MGKKLVRVALWTILACLVLTAGFLGYMLLLQGNGAAEVPAAAMEETVNGTAEESAGETGKPSTPSTVSEQGTPPVEKPADKPVRITAVGDILLGRGVGYYLKKQETGYEYAFENVKEYLKKGDVVFANLEEAFTDNTRSLTDLKQKGKIVLKNDMDAFDAFKNAGFNLLSLANNHIMDYYQEGLQDTLQLLDLHGIAHAGAGKNLEEARKLAVVERNGVKVGLLAYTDMAKLLYKGDPPLRFAAEENKGGVVPRDTALVLEDVENVREKVDILMVSFHWGVEDSYKILPEQEELAHKLIDAGVDVVLGHHPHQFQGIEIYKGRPIVYSMGNFLFDQNEPENQESFIVDIQFTGDRLTELSLQPVRTLGKCRVVPVSGKEAEALLKRQMSLSEERGARCSVENNRIVYQLETLTADGKS